VVIDAARRIAPIYGGIVVATVLVSALIGLAAGADVLHAVAVGLYIVGAVLLLGCFVTGVRGPMRGVSRSGETVPLAGARGVRRATLTKRSEATQISVLLFILGFVLIVLGALLDPAHKAY
jgi:hypothetical protein